MLLARRSGTLVRSLHAGTDDAHLKRETNRLLRELLSIFTEDEQLSLRRVSGALTNRVFVCSSPGNAHVLLRLYGHGTNVFFSREQEIRTFRALSDLGFGPKLLGEFPDGRFEEYIDSDTLHAAELRDPATSRAIAAQIARLHNAYPVVADGSSRPTSELWTRMADWTAKAHEAVARARLPADWNAAALVVEVAREQRVLQAAIDAHALPVVFCHNDVRGGGPAPQASARRVRRSIPRAALGRSLADAFGLGARRLGPWSQIQHGNVLRRKGSGELTLIDYEYAGLNYRGFDLGNHFCEWVRGRRLAGRGAPMRATILTGVRGRGPVRGRARYLDPRRADGRLRGRASPQVLPRPVPVASAAGCLLRGVPRRRGSDVPVGRPPRTASACRGPGRRGQRVCARVPPALVAVGLDPGRQLQYRL